MPNFVLIIIDDLGYGDIEPFGSTINHTPNLCQMAEEGMKLTSFYATAPLSTPSRAGLMTGCYPKRVGLAYGWKWDTMMPGDPYGLNPDEKTIAEVLKDIGYATGCFGKWHLGDQPEFLPTKQGFDEYFGIPYSNDMWPRHPRAGSGDIWNFPHLPIVHNDKVVDKVENMKDQAELCKLFTEEAIKFIKKNKSRPFFVYIPHAFIHNPNSAREEFMKNAKNAREAQIEEVDWSVGEILNTLRELKLSNNTLVIFTSDNGGGPVSANKPLRGRKNSSWEGGMRVPIIAWWPGNVPSGSTCDKIATIMDFLPTFASLAGAKVPEDRIIDGKDISELLFGNIDIQSPYDAFFYYWQNDLQAVRSAQWKLFEDGRLYNLEKDISESQNVAELYPTIVVQLEGYLEQIRNDIGDEEQVGKNCRPVGIVKNPQTLLPREDYSRNDSNTNK